MTWRDWIRGPEIEPSIYAADFLRLGAQLETLLDAGARIVHVDVGDGRFIPPVTIGPVIVQAIAPLVHAATREVRFAFREAYREFISAFRRASELFRSSNGRRERFDLFPPGSFPPPGPFLEMA